MDPRFARADGCPRQQDAGADDAQAPGAQRGAAGAGDVKEHRVEGHRVGQVLPPDHLDHKGQPCRQVHRDDQAADEGRRQQVPLVALAAAPLYIAAKLPIYLAFVCKRRVQWVRTQRDPVGG